MWLANFVLTPKEHRLQAAAAGALFSFLGGFLSTSYLVPKRNDKSLKETLLQPHLVNYPQLGRFICSFLRNWKSKCVCDHVRRKASCSRRFRLVKPVGGEKTKIWRQSQFEYSSIETWSEWRTRTGSRLYTVDYFICSTKPLLTKSPNYVSTFCWYALFFSPM